MPARLSSKDNHSGCGPGLSLTVSLSSTNALSAFPIQPVCPTYMARILAKLCSDWDCSKCGPGLSLGASLCNATASTTSSIWLVCTNCVWRMMARLWSDWDQSGCGSCLSSSASLCSSVAVVWFRSVFWLKTQNPELDWGQVRRGRLNLEPNYRFWFRTSLNHRTGHFYFKNHKNNTRGRKLIKNNQRGSTRSRGEGTDSGRVCVAREGGGSGVEDAFSVCVPVRKCQVERDVQKYMCNTITMHHFFS